MNTKRDILKEMEIPKGYLDKESGTINSLYPCEIINLFPNKPEIIYSRNETWYLYTGELNEEQKFCAVYSPEAHPSAIKSVFFGNLSDNEDVIRTIIYMLTEGMEAQLQSFQNLELVLPDKAFDFKYGENALKELDNEFHEKFWIEGEPLKKTIKQVDEL